MQIKPKLKGIIMVHSQKELSEMLNEHAQRVCPKLKLSFETLRGQERVLFAEVKVVARVHFSKTELEELSDSSELGRLFKRRLSGSLVEIAREAFDSEI
jgi:hypothetical protein